MKFKLKHFFHVLIAASSGIVIYSVLNDIKFALGASLTYLIMVEFYE